MRIQSSIHGGVTVLALSGELVCDSVAKLRAAIADAAEQRRDFLVDLHGVTAIDSVGLEALTALQRQCEEQLGMVSLCGPDRNVRKILEMTRLDKQFAISETVEQALSSFAAT